MELLISMKNNKYVVEDKDQGRTIYTVKKKKGFGAPKYLLMDPSNYQLYSLVQVSDDRKPAFIISHNESSLMQLACTSLFLDPSIGVKGKDMGGVPQKYTLASKDHRNFEITKEDKNVGSVSTSMTVNKELQYDLTIENKIFDDYIILFVIAIDLAFGDINRNEG